MVEIRGENTFFVKPWDESIERSKILDIINSRNKYTNPDFAVELKENALDYWFGKDAILSREVLRFETNDGKIVGFAGLTNYSGSAKTFRVIHAILPEYFQTDLPSILIEAAIELGITKGLSKLIFPIFGSVSAPFEEVMMSKGIVPAIFVYDMVMTDSDALYQPENPEGVNFHEKSILEDYKAYINVVNKAFRGTFEFSESKIDDIKKHVEIVTSHGLKYMHCLAFLNNTLVGVCDSYYYPNELKGVIESISVLPFHQHSGIGSALLSFCLDSLKKKGSKKIMVGVRVNSRKSLKFYEKIGFIASEEKVQKFYQIL